MSLILLLNIYYNLHQYNSYYTDTEEIYKNIISIMNNGLH